MQRNILRKEMLTIRDALSQKDREQFSGKIAERIIHSKEFQEADCLLSYMSFRSEVDTTQIHVAALKNNKKLYLPRTYSKEHRIRFFHVDSLADLESGYMGILEPAETEDEFVPKNMIQKPTVMIMPGVAFDSEKFRMGYGGGFYDRFLSKCSHSIMSIMVAYDCQKTVSTLPKEHDQKPQIICTETTWLQ
ncbi:MAG: 5-formyltetrahydrofolate cyclo-ligase [Eubacterium sp.]|nr:5-formyltetrahydrofolate cyclo-ligase [Eubacterium sp.]